MVIYVHILRFMYLCNFYPCFNFHVINKGIYRHFVPVHLFLKNFSLNVLGTGISTSKKLLFFNLSVKNKSFLFITHFFQEETKKGYLHIILHLS